MGTMGNGAARTTDPLLGGGEMGALMRSIDWSRTAVGPSPTWPQSLRTALSILLETGFPMYIAWGPEFTQFYNDGYRPILGSTKHPAAHGAQHPGHLRGDLGHHRPDVRGRDARDADARWSTSCCRSTATASSRSATSSSRTAPSARRAATSAASSSPSPRRRSACSARGGSDAARARRRRPQKAATAEAACAAAAGVLAENPADLPFALLYLLDARRHGGRRSPAPPGIEPGSPPRPARIDLRCGGAALAARRASSRPVRRASVEELPVAAGPLPATRGAAVLPIAQPGRGAAGRRAGRRAQPAPPPRRELPQLPRARRRPDRHRHRQRARARRGQGPRRGAGRDRPRQDGLLQQRQPRVPHAADADARAGSRTRSRRGRTRCRADERRALAARAPQRAAAAQAGQHAARLLPHRGRPRARPPTSRPISPR